MDYQQQLLAAMAAQSQLYNNNQMAAYAAAASGANPFAFYGLGNGAAAVNPLQLMGANGFGWPTGAGSSSAADNSYLMNIAAWQHMVSGAASFNPASAGGAASALMSPSSLFGLAGQPSSTATAGSGACAETTESFADVLSRMPRAPTTTATVAAVSDPPPPSMTSATTLSDSALPTEGVGGVDLTNGGVATLAEKRSESAFHSVRTTPSDAPDTSQTSRRVSASATPPSAAALPARKRTLDCASVEGPESKVSKSSAPNSNASVSQCKAESSPKKTHRSGGVRTHDSKAAAKLAASLTSAASTSSTASVLDSLSSNVQMNPQLLQASAAMFNQILMDMAQKEFVRQLQQQQQQLPQVQQPVANSNTTVAASPVVSRRDDNKKCPPKKHHTSSVAAKPVLATPSSIHQRQKSPSSSPTSSGRGRPATISTSPIDFGAFVEDDSTNGVDGEHGSSPLSADQHSTVDEVIDSVVRQQQEMARADAIRSRLATTLPSFSNRRKNGAAPVKIPSAVGGDGVTDGCAGDSGSSSIVMTVREQLAMKRAREKDDPDERSRPSPARNNHQQTSSSSIDSPLDLSIRSDMDSVDRVLEETIQKAQGSLGSHQDRSQHDGSDKRLRFPLAKGWSRQTCVWSVSKNGIKGDVVYYTPSRKRLSSQVELIRHLSKYKVKDLTKEHFSFSPKVLVGEFVKMSSDSPGANGVVPMTETEINNMIGTAGNEQESDKMEDGSLGLGAGQESTQKKVLSKNETASSSNGAGKPPVAAAATGLWGGGTTAREQEEAAAAEEAHKYLETVRMTAVKEHETQRQQMALMQEQEQERIRQQLLVSQRQKQDEDRRTIAEKLIKEEEKNAAREAQLLRTKQLRQPTEDLAVEETKPLPPLERVRGLRLSGIAFADLLMVVEFVHNFGHVLKIQEKDLPSLDEMHAGLLNDAAHVRATRKLTTTLVTLVLEYPGLAAGAAGRTFLGQSAKDVGVTGDNYSELLRMFLLSRDAQGKQLGQLLADRSFEGLSPDDKAAILAYMCNELLFCRNVVREIEGNIDEVAKIKGEKWIKEGKQRLLRNIQASKRLAQAKTEPAANSAALLAPPAIKRDLTPMSTQSDESEPPAELQKTPVAAISEVKEEPLNESATEEATTKDPEESTKVADIAVACPNGDDADLAAKAAAIKAKPLPPGSNQAETLTEEEKLMSPEELEVVVGGLNREIEEARARIDDMTARVRVQPLGVDRYCRQYWQLPKWSGALLVEAAESSTHRSDAAAVGFRADVPARWRHSHAVDDPDVEQCLFDVLEKVDESESSPKSGIRGDQTTRRVPLTLQRGWWRIGDAALLERVRNSMQTRGIRERLLARMLAKCDTTPTSITFGPRHEALSDTTDCITSNVVETNTYHQVARQIRAFEEKVLHANVHNRQWKPLRVKTASAANQVKSHQSAVHPKAATNGLSPIGLVSPCDDEDAGKSSGDTAALSLDNLKQRLISLEQNVERRYLQHPFNPSQSLIPEAVLGSCSHPGTPTTTPGTPNTALGAVFDMNNKETDDSVAAPGASDVDRKSPTAAAATVNSDDASAGDVPGALAAEAEEAAGQEEEEPAAVSDELSRWRAGVTGARTAAQLSLAVQQLDANVAWEKSIMRASCQLCRSGENESQLLLCDGCDMGYHTYCFKPQMEVIPDGDWYCPACVTRVSDRPCCLVCCRQDEDDAAAAADAMLVCVQCDNAFHRRCLLLPQAPSQPADLKTWKCQRCLVDQSETAADKCISSVVASAAPAVNGVNTDTINGEKTAAALGNTCAGGLAAPKSKTACKRDRKSANHAKSAAAGQRKDEATNTDCAPLSFPESASKMLAELCAHKDCWPFKTPVDLKAFPFYKKVIRKPMDLSAVKIKLAHKRYDTPEQFEEEVRLIFENCRTFNEDDSPVGKAGRIALRFFNRRWKEIYTPSSSSSPPPVQSSK